MRNKVLENYILLLHSNVYIKNPDVTLNIELHTIISYFFIIRIRIDAIRRYQFSYLQNTRVPLDQTQGEC